MNRIWTYYILPVLWTTTIFVLSLLPASDLPGEGWLKFPGSDKLMHYLFYLVLQVLWLLSLDNNGDSRKKKMLISLFACMALGGIIEILQGFTTTRTPDFLDWLADILGLITGLLAFFPLVKVKAKLISKFRYLSYVFRP